MDGVYYKEWSAFLDREMEFKVYGCGSVPVLALPARGGRFYDWENNGMPDAVAHLLDDGKLQLFCADSLDPESFLDGHVSPRRRAERQEAYFNYLTGELADRILTLNRAASPAPAKAKKLWCAGVDLGAYQAVNCRLRRPQRFAGAIALSGFYEVGDLLGGRGDDLALRNSPLDALAVDGLLDRRALAAADENALLLCAGQGAREDEARASAHALYAALCAAGVPAHFEEWGDDVSHDWYWWSREFGLFAERLFAEKEDEVRCPNL